MGAIRATRLSTSSPKDNGRGHRDPRLLQTPARNWFRHRRDIGRDNPDPAATQAHGTAPARAVSGSVTAGGWQSCRIQAVGRVLTPISVAPRYAGISNHIHRPRGKSGRRRAGKRAFLILGNSFRASSSAPDGHPADKQTVPHIGREQAAELLLYGFIHLKHDNTTARQGICLQVIVGNPVIANTSGRFCGTAGVGITRSCPKYASCSTTFFFLHHHAARPQSMQPGFQCQAHIPGASRGVWSSRGERWLIPVSVTSTSRGPAVRLLGGCALLFPTLGHSSACYTHRRRKPGARRRALSSVAMPQAAAVGLRRALSEAGPIGEIAVDNREKYPSFTASLCPASASSARLQWVCAPAARNHIAIRPSWAPRAAVANIS